MQYRKFGRTGWDVSEISFGAWQLGGQWGPVDDDESVRSLLAAYEAGVNFVDTAEMYGAGHSEVVVGRSLAQWRGEPVRVATKVQPVSWPDPSDDSPEIGAAYPAEYLRAQVAASLERLGVERLDLLQLHCWMPDGMRNLEWFETLSELREAGLIDRIGVSLRDYRSDEGIELARSGLVDSIQVIYNIFEQAPAAELFPAAASTGTAIVVRVALDSGSLAGTWNQRTYAEWPEGSVQKTMFRDGRFAETLARLEKVKGTTQPFYETLDEAAIRFTLAPPEVSTTIVGMSTARRLGRNVGYSDGDAFAEGLRDQLVAHQWNRNFYL